MNPLTPRTVHVFISCTRHLGLVTGSLVVLGSPDSSAITFVVEKQVPY